MKSIYKPGELAALDIVVLNGTGAPVCPANITMQITDPNFSLTVLSSDNVIQSSCGLYLANYPTTIAGNYTINIQAETGNGIVNFATYFTVLDHYDYDIIRYTDSKIDPFTDPNEFDVDIDITSFVGNNELTVHEYVPSSFNVFNTDAVIETIGNQKVLTWKKTPQDGFVDTFGYSYSVPLVTPELYTLGKMQIDQSGIPTFTEARNWFVAVDPHFIIDTSVTTNDDRWQDAAKRTVAVNGTHIYTFFIDLEQDIAYRYSTNGGLSWNYGGELESSSLLFLGLAAWYESDTPGRTSKLIHIAAYDGGSDSMYYIKFDPTTSTIITPLTNIGDGSGNAFGTLDDSGNVSITVSTNGTLYVGTVDNANPSTNMARVRASIDGGTTWVNAGVKLSIWGSDDGSDSVVLLPLPSNNILLVSLDVSADVLRSKVYNSLSDTWDSTWTTIDTGVADNTAYDHAVSGTVDKVTGDVYVTAVPNVAAVTTSKVKLYSYNGASWNTSLPDVIGTTTGRAFVDTSLGIDEDARKLYVIYNYGTVATSTNVYYKSSPISSISWENEKQLTNSTSNFRGLSINSNTEELLYADFFNTDPNQLHGTTVLKKPLNKEIMKISDSISTKKTASRTLSETLSASDSIFGAKSTTLTETMSISDVVTTKKPLSIITLSETLSISDSISTKKYTSRTLSETLVLSDVIDAAKTKPGDDPDTRPKVRVLTGTSSSTTSTDVPITPSLEDATKAFAMCTFSHVSQDRHSKTFRAWEITSASNLRIYASTASVDSVDYVCNIIEFGSASTVKGQTSTFTQSAGGSTTVSTPLSIPVDIAETMEWYQGHVHNQNDNGIGTYELDRVRLTSTTNWEWKVITAPTTGPQNNILGVLDWNNLNVKVQRGTTTIASSTTSKTLTAGTDFTGTAADRSRSLLFVSFVKESATSPFVPNTSYIRATIDSSGNLVFTRNTSEATVITINWTLVQLPVDYANIRHGVHTQSSGTANNTFDLTLGDSVNLARSFVIGTVCTPFGCGSGSSSSTTGGAIDRLQATLTLDDADTVRVTRGDGTDSFSVGYQVIEFLPKKRIVTETLSLSDKISTKTVFKRTLSETLTASDIVSTNTGKTRNLSETL
ncbi:hypothetical protein, partial [Candidatus Nitrosarchaeum limnium]